MLIFDAGSFSDISETEMGKSLWEFLNNEDIFIRLETASYLKRPALEGVQLQLLERFGDPIRADRWKQMIGRMTRQIMEHRGYSLDRAGVRVIVNDLFTSAARYKKLPRYSG